MKKRILALLLVFSLCFTQLAMTANAREVTDKNDASAVVTVGNVEASNAAGTDITVPVTLSLAKAGTKVTSIGIEVKYDTSILTLKEFDTGNLQDMVNSPLTLLYGSATPNVNNGVITWASTNAISADGVLFRLKFTVKAGYLKDTYPIKCGLSLPAGVTDENADRSASFTDTSTGSAVPVDVYFEAGGVTFTDGLRPEDLQPTISAGPQSATYTYSNPAPTPDALTVTATPAQDGAELSYQWYSNGTESTTGGTAITDAKADSYIPKLQAFGTTYYYCVVSNTVGDKTYSATSDVAAVTYEKAVLGSIAPAGEAATYTYTGSAQGPDSWVVKDNAATPNTVATTEYDLTNGGQQINADTYTVKATAKSDGNYTGEVSTTWSIAKAEITTNANPTMTIYTNGQAFPIADTVLNVATQGSQTATVTYSVKSGAVELDTSNKTLKATGNLESTAVVTANISADNHESKTVDIQVAIKTKNDVSGQLTFTAQSGPFTYDETKKALTTYVKEANYTGTAVEGSNITYMLDNKPVQLTDQMVLDAGKHIFVATYDDPTNNGVKTVEIDIAKKEITPTMTWPSTAYTYDGTAQSITATVDADAKYQITGYTGNTQTNAGTYTVTANLAIKSECATNYELSAASVEKTDWTIAQATALALTDTVSIRFNDTTPRTVAPSDIAALATGKTLGTVSITTAAKETDTSNAIGSVNADAGSATYSVASGLPEPPMETPYTATIKFTFTSTNYEDSTLMLTVNVTAKTPVDASKLTFNDQTVTYNGEAQTIAAAAYTGPTEGTGAITYTYDPADVKNVGEYTVTATYTDNAYICTKTAKLTIAPAPLTITGATVTEKDYDKTTTATVSAVTFNGLQNNEQLTEATDYTVTGAFADANAGENKSVTVTVELVADGTVSKNYTLPTATFTTTGTINKKTVTPTVALSESSFVFNNTEQKPTVTVTYTDNGTVTMDPKEYIVTYTGDCLNAGATGADEPTVTVTANSTNYTFDEVVQHYTITKTTASAPANINKSYKYDSTAADTVTMPTLTNAGETTYALGDAYDSTNAIVTGAEVSTAGVLSYTLSGQASLADPAQTVTIPVKITSQNYNDVTVNVVITLTDKNVPTVSANDITKVYDGEDLSGITGTATFDGAAVPGTWSIVSPVASEVKNASATAYNVTVKFTPDDKDAYAEVEDQITVTISKATPTVTPTFTAITEAGKTLADAALACTSEPAGSIAWDDGNATVVVANQSYGWTFTPTDTTNYETATGTLIPFVQNPPDETEEPNVPPILPPSGGNGSGSTGGGSGSGSGNQGGSTTNPDQSVTTTTTDRDGNVTTTTTYPDGSKSVVEMKTDGTIISTDTDAQGNTATVTQNPDGSSVKTVENIDGSSSIQNTTSDGQTSAMVNLPSETVDASNASGAPASLPMDAVTATKDSATAPVVMVNTANDEPVKVEIPVTNANNGTVAVLVKADGTEEIIKTTALTGDGVAVKVNSGDTVKIIDNTKTFSDTATHWGSDAVTFVAARELFSGTSETRFSPDDNMTRGMLMTVLARYENVDTNGGSVWYEKGVAWAVAQGLSDGTNPNGQISREQLATIIYRYAQSKGIDTTAGGSLERFPDAGSVSDWAREAMSWAVGNGIISGVGGVTLDPSGNATRAQVATILMRFSEKFPA